MKEIVNRVQTVLDYEVLSITDYPVGLESRAKEVIGLTETRSNQVCMIGIWGMGDRGKLPLPKPFTIGFIADSWIKVSLRISEKIVKVIAESMFLCKKSFFQKS